jgi:hypothetical protein
MVVFGSHFVVTTALWSTVLALPHRPIRRNIVAVAEAVETPAGIKAVGFEVSLYFDTNSSHLLTYLG